MRIGVSVFEKNSKEKIVDSFKSQGFTGIEISESVEVLLLLFADDLVLVAPSKINLQKKIECLRYYCVLNGLEIDMEKTKVVIFRRGGRLAVHGKFCYGDKNLDIVKTYTYLGVHFHL